MPVTLTALPVIAFSINPIWVKLSSDDYISVQPVAAVNYLEFDGPVAVNDFITLVWGTTQLTLTAVATPDNSGTQIPAGDGSQAYVTALAAQLKNAYLFYRDFQISTDFTGSKPRLVFTAINTGTSCTFQGAQSAAANMQSGNITAGADLTLQSNFAHHLEVWAKRGGDQAFSKQWEYNLELDFPFTGTSTTDISGILHNFLDSDVPALTGVAFAAAQNSVAQYYLVYGQYIGDTPTVQNVQQSNIYQVVFGGLDKTAALTGDIFSEFTRTIPALTRLMRQGSKNVFVTKEQPEWLSAINLTGADQVIALEITLNFADASTITFQQPASYNFAAGQKVCFPAGYNQLNLDSKVPAGKILSFYSLCLRSAGAPVSLTYGYILDPVYREWPRYFVFLNAYGAFQTLATIGKQQPSVDRLVQNAQLDITDSKAATAGEFLEYNTTIRKKNTANIGYARSDPRSVRLLRSFIASEEKYLYKNGQLVPITLTTTNLKETPDGENVYASSFEYQEAFENRVYTESADEADLPLPVVQPPGVIKPVDFSPYEFDPNDFNA